MILGAKRIGRLRSAVLLLCLGLAPLVAWEAVSERRTLIASASPFSSSAIGVEHLGHVPNLRASFVSRDGRVYGMEDHHLFVSNDGGRTYERLGTLPELDHSWFAHVRDMVARSKTLRALRPNEGPSNVVVLSSGTILVFYDRIYRSQDGGRTFAVAFEREAKGIGGPFPGAQNVAVGDDDTVYFGEYVNGPRPQTIRIMRGSNDGRDWSIAHAFQPGETFHVHAVQYDRYRDRYWILTGDRDAESAIYFTDDDFGSLKRLGGGSQDWRAVTLMITEKALFWGSDNDSVSGADIFRFDLRSNRLDRLGHIGKVSYYSTVLKDGTLVLSTAYEPETEYTKAHKPTPSTDLWMSADGEHWRKVAMIPYKPETNRLGRLARAFTTFPGGERPDLLLFTPTNTAAFRFTTLAARFDRQKLDSSVRKEANAAQ